MSLTLTDLQGELREYFTRVEEVLSGMDSLLAQFESRLARLEQGLGTGAVPVTATAEQRIARLEGQLAALVEGLYGNGSEPGPGAGGIVIGR